MSRFKKLAHAVYESKYHVVWCPKYRYRILQGEVGRGVREIIRELCALGDKSGFWPGMFGRITFIWW